MQVGQERRDEQGSHIAFTVRQLVREIFNKFQFCFTEENGVLYNQVP